MRMPIALLIAASLVAACGKPVSGAPSEVPPSLAPAATSAATSAASSPTAFASPLPTRYPATDVRIIVNGTDAPGGAVVLDGASTTTVLLIFPFAVDRATVDQWLSPALRASETWAADRTLQLSIPSTEPFPAFKLGEVRSADGTGVLGPVVVALRYAPSILLGVYSVADALASSGAKPSSSWRVKVADAFAVSPDVTRVLLYDAPPTQARIVGRPGPASGRTPQVLELSSGALTDVALGPDDGPFAFGGWLPDGRVLFVGHGAWVGGPHGETLRRVADLAGVEATSAQPSPKGGYVAIAAPDAVRVVRIADGSIRTIPGSGQGCGSGLAWSADDKLLAWIDCAAKAVRVSDASTGGVVRTLAGETRAVASMPTGDLIVTRDSGERGEGQRSLGIVYGFDGTEKARYLGYAWSVSADGRFLLNIGSCCAGGPSSRLSDARTPGAPEVMLPGIASWTADGRILVTSLGQ